MLVLLWSLATNWNWLWSFVVNSANSIMSVAVTESTNTSAEAQKFHYIITKVWDSSPAEPTLGSLTSPHSSDLSPFLLFLSSCILLKIWLKFKIASSSQFEALSTESGSPGRAETLKAFMLTASHFWSLKVYQSFIYCTIFLMETHFGIGSRSLSITS